MKHEPVVRGSQKAGSTQLLKGKFAWQLAFLGNPIHAAFGDAQLPFDLKIHSNRARPHPLPEREPHGGHMDQRGQGTTLYYTIEFSNFVQKSFLKIIPNLQTLPCG